VSSSIACFYFNARSLNSVSKRQELLRILDEEKFGVILITETWLNETTPSALLCHNTNYALYRCDRKGNRHGGGVCMFVHNSFSASAQKLPTRFETLEFVCIDILAKKDHTRFLCVYRPPNSDQLAAYTEKLCDLITVVCSVNYPVYVLGDFNYPDIEWNPVSAVTPCARAFIDCLSVNNLTQFVSAPTRGNNLLDLILSNIDEGVYDVHVQEPFLDSDHCSITFSVPGISGVRSLEKESVLRDFRRADYDRINEYLCAVDWNFLFADCEDSVQKHWDMFVCVARTAIENPKYVPLSRRRKAKSTLPPHILKLRKQKNALYKQSKNSFEYKQCAKEYKTALRQHYVEREESILGSGDVNALYRFARARFKSKEMVPSLQNDQGQFIVEDKDKAALLNEKFASVFTEDDGNFPDFPRRVSSDAELCDVSFSEYAVYKALLQLPNKVSGTPDELPALFLKNAAVSVAEPLSTIFNLSFKKHELPKIWLSANVVPLYKKNVASDPLNYRPISLTSVCSKVMESIARESIVSFLSVENAVSKEQHGFRKNRSTVTQLLESEIDYFERLLAKRGVDIVFLDFAKAFDSVCHNKLLHKLKSYGICGDLLQWLSAFLRNRTQRVTINGVFSESVSVKSSVPQGSVLGPLLFLLYINDIVDCVQNMPVHIKLFADDVKVYSSVSDSASLQIVLNSITAWAAKWQLRLACNKCVVLSLGRGGNHGNLYSVGNRLLNRELSCRDLGVQITHNVKSSDHCNLISDKAMRRMGMIFRVFSCKRVNILLKAYKTYVQPLVESASVTWCPYLHKDIDAVEKVQRFFTRRLFKRCNLQAATYAQRLAYLGLESLELRRIRTDLVMYYNIIHGESAIKRSRIFQMAASRSRGHSLKLKKPFCHTNYLENAFCVRRVNLWNELPEIVVSSTSSGTFVQNLGRFVDLQRSCVRY